MSKCSSPNYNERVGSAWILKLVSFLQGNDHELSNCSQQARYCFHLVKFVWMGPKNEISPRGYFLQAVATSQFLFTRIMFIRKQEEFLFLIRSDQPIVFLPQTANLVALFSLISRRMFFFISSTNWSLIKTEQNQIIIIMIQSEIVKKEKRSIFKCRSTTNANLEDKPLIDSLITLKKLKNIHLIPKRAKLIELKKKELSLLGQKLTEKHLIINSNNVIYYGQLSNDGIPEDDSGICIFAEGSYYKGQFKNGKMEGNGTLGNLQGSYFYEGEWKNGLPHGNGRQRIENNIYEGQFYEGQKEGKGIQKYADGSCYEGDFCLNKVEGKGKFVFQENTWKGIWKDGYLEGEGQQNIIRKAHDGKDEVSFYKGNFKKGEKHGKGNYRWGQDYSYDGQFKNGQLDGTGVFGFKGKCFVGQWENGVEIKLSEVSSRSKKSTSKDNSGKLF